MNSQGVVLIMYCFVISLLSYHSIPYLCRVQLAREVREQQETEERYAELAKGPNWRQIEDTKLAAIFKTIKFDGSLDGVIGGSVKVIKGDGHCLFTALIDQLTLQSHTQGKLFNADTVSSLRQKASDYMRGHKDDFIPFLLDDDSDDIMSYDDMEVYCDKLLNMNSDILLGGHAELVALSHQLKHRIVVYMMDSAPIVIGEEYTQNPTLHVSYHKHFVSLGEHYNSVVPVPSETNEDSEDEE